MLEIVHGMGALDFSALCRIYSGSFGQNALRAEQGLYWDTQAFFSGSRENCCCILREQGNAVAALRLEPYRDGLILTGLETAPAERRKGHAARLVTLVQQHFPDRPIYSHVHRKNKASMAVHRRCGFRVLQDTAVLLDGSADAQCSTLVWQKSPEK